MRIGGLQKLTLIDYPAKTAATIFTIGCNFACPFCFNAELVEMEKIKEQPIIKSRDIFDFLASRRGLLDAVCLTGGEPTLQPDLESFIKRIKKQGFLVKLDTNGSEPAVLESLFQKKLLDFVAMDIKTSPWRYEELAGPEIKLENILKSVLLIRQSGVGHQFRTTVVPGLVTEKEIREIGRWLKGAGLFVLQQFRPEKTLEKSYQNIKPYSGEQLQKYSSILADYVRKVEVVGI